MDIYYILVIFLIGFVGSFISGMVGIGGSIIKYPMLLYIPVLLGVSSFTAHEVSGISAVQVFFATIAGVFAYIGSGFLNKKLIISMGSSVLIGSLLGSYISVYFSSAQINIVYAILATIAAIMMLIPKKEQQLNSIKSIDFNVSLAVILALFVGISSGIVGAAGAFILVPIMLVFLKIPTRVTIASSLAITFISSIGSTVGKVVTDQVLYAPAVIMVVASIIASPLGAKMGQKINTIILKWMLAVLIIATALKIWVDVF